MRTLYNRFGLVLVCLIFTSSLWGSSKFMTASNPKITFVEARNVSGGDDCATATEITNSGTYTADFSGAGDEKQWFTYTFPTQGTITLSPDDCDADLFIDWQSDCVSNITSYFNGCGGASPLFESTFTYLGEAGEQIYLQLNEVFDLDDAQNDLAVTVESRANIDSILTVKARSYVFNGRSYASSGYYESEDTLMSSAGQDSIVYLKLSIDTNYGTSYANAETLEGDGELTVDNLNINENWFSYVASQDGILIASTCGYTTANTKIDLYDENSSVTPVATSNNSFKCDQQSEVIYEVNAGQEFRIRFSGGSFGAVNEIYTALVETRENVPGSWYGNTIKITEGIHTVDHAAVGGDVYYYVDLMDDFETAGLRISTCDAATTNTAFEVYFDEFGASLNPPLFSSEDEFGVTDCGNGLKSMDATGLELGSWIIRFQNEASTSSYDFEMVNMDFCDAFGWNNGSTQDVTAENSYDFDGQTLTESGTYIATFENQFACDSLVTLNLTIEVDPCADLDITELVTTGIYTADNSGGDHFFSYVAEQSGNLFISTLGHAESVDTFIKLDDDCDQDNGAINDNNNQGVLQSYLHESVVAGETYIIVMDDEFTNASYDFEIGYLSDAGYTCANPLTMVEGTYDLILATGQLVYEYTALEDGDLTISSDVDTYIDVYSEGNCNLIQYGDLGSYDSENGDTGQSLTVAGLTQGQQVIIALSADAAYSIAVSVSLSNENACDSPEILSEGSHDIESSSGAYWISYTPTENGTLTVERTDNVGSIDMGLYDGCDQELVEPGYEDDYLIYGVEALRNYLIYFESLSTTQTQSVNIALDTDVHGHSCHDPIWLTEGAHEVPTADIELFGKSHFAFVWPENGTLTVSTCADDSPTNDPRLTIFDGNCEVEVVLDDNNIECGLYAREGYTVDGVTGDHVVVFLESISANHAPQILLDFAFQEDCETLPGSETVEACESYDWEGTTYTESGDYSVTFTNAAGCDSLATLNLTILEATSGSETIEACENYDWEGTTYTESGDYSVTLTNAAGCDSLATLNLTILEATSGSESVEACESYEWEGNTYTETGDYTVTLTNTAGCDSVATLNLTILESTSSLTEESAYESYTWNDQTYTASGDYEAFFINEAGCDSTAMLTLTILEKEAQTLTFEEIEEKVYGEASFELTTSSSAGLSVVYTSSDESVATVEGNSVTIVGAGSTTLTATQSGDDTHESASATQELQVNQASLSVIASDLSKVFGEENPELTWTYEGFVNNEDAAVLELAPSASTTATTTSDAGDYSIVMSGGSTDNYSLVYVDGTLTIEKAAQVIIFESLEDRLLSEVSFELSGSVDSDLEISYVSSDTQIATIDGNTVYLLSAGTTVITAYQLGDDNHEAAVEVEQTLTINTSQQPQEITFNTISSQVYGSDPVDLNAIASSGLAVSYQSSDESVVVVDGSLATAVGVGSATITAFQSGNDNYTSAEEVARSFVVLPAKLVVAVDDQSKVYGTANPELTYSLSGFVNDENEAVLITNPTVNTLVDASTDVGSYDITVAGGSAANYELEYQDGTFSIVKASLTITADDQFMRVGGEVPELTMSYDGWVNGDGPEAIDVVPAIRSTASSNSEVGSYEITLSGGEDNNYSLTLVNGVLTIDEVLSVGLEEVSLQLFPNPFGHELTIRFPETAQREAKTIELLNASGQILRSERSDQNLIKWPMEELKSGLYLLRMQQGEEQKLWKIYKR